ncbi:fasciclin-like arabinogalactan protein 13 [Tripterygium wilfordii]|uniref:fasciclin-like arabinogalactan protein 13 n=1 Tax=Tripterygium wilfordii TaxID=458696 RepID=UPI0018F85061|nr:fasciclin-like arabinogalactan protein 13 [Tripterygium wilfordii]
MAASTILPLILLTLTPVLLITIPQTLAQTPVAPAPAPAGPVNLTGILDKNGQYTTLIRLLQQTQVGTQVNNQLNGSTEGMTVFAPTDNAFNNLKAGTLNGLNNQQQVQLVLYHIAPKYYSLSDLQSVPNPVRTQATGQNGGVFGLNFTSQGNQVNVSSGMVVTQINNALRQQFPLAVYQVDKVLLPEELFEAKSPSEAPSDVDKGSPADGKNSTRTVGAEEPSTAGNGSGGLNVGFGVVVGLALACMGVLS